MARSRLAPLWCLLAATLLLATLSVAVAQEEDLYEVLGLERNATSDDVSEAVERLSTKWDPQQSSDPEAREKTLEVRHAAQVLGHEELRLLYDQFGVNDLKDEVAQVVRREGSATEKWEPSKALWDPLSGEAIPSTTAELTEDNLAEVLFSSDVAWLVQLYTPYSRESRAFAEAWESLATQMSGMMFLGRVNIGQQPALATRMGEINRRTNKPHFPRGLPEVLGKPPLCTHIDCLLRFRGMPTEAELQEFAVERVLRIPPIKLYGVHNIIEKFFRKAALHKVRFLYLMDRGELSPPPVVRFWAAQFWKYTEWAALPFFEHDMPLWTRWWGISNPPAMAIFQDPGMEPYVHHGPINGSFLHHLIMQHRNFQVPQLRSLNTMEIGCDPFGYPRAGRNPDVRQTWYCAAVVALPNIDLAKARATLLEVQNRLQANSTPPIETETEDGTLREEPNAAIKAWHEKRLTMAWLDGKLQRKYCGYHMGFEANIVCPKVGSDGKDVGLYMTLYQRAPQEPGAPPQPKAAQFVAVFSGNVSNIDEIEEWMHTNIAGGDPYEFPVNKQVPPPLVPEDSISWQTKVRTLLALSGEAVRERAQALAPGLTERLEKVPAQVQQSAQSYIPKRDSPWTRLLVLALILVVSVRILRRLSLVGRSPPVVAVPADGEAVEASPALPVEVAGVADTPASEGVRQRVIPNPAAAPAVEPKAGVSALAMNGVKLD